MNVNQSILVSLLEVKIYHLAVLSTFFTKLNLKKNEIPRDVWFQQQFSIPAKNQRGFVDPLGQTHLKASQACQFKIIFVNAPITPRN